MKLKNAFRHGIQFVYIDNFHWWDIKSIELLSLLLQYAEDFLPELNNVILISNITTNQQQPYSDTVNEFLAKSDSRLFNSYPFDLKSIALAYNKLVC